MTTKGLGDSVTQKLLVLQKKTGVPFPSLVTEFLIERLVVRLMADSHLQKALVFKGGFVSLKVYESDRYTIDLDALLVKSDVSKTLERTKAAAEADLGDGVWFVFEEQIDLDTQGEYGGIRQAYRVGIGPKLKQLKKAQIINFDLGIGDPITPKALTVATPSLLSKEELSWSVYPIETMIAEKIHALISLGAANSRAKDVYDLTIFLPKADASTLGQALKKTFKFRNTDLPDDPAGFISGLETKSLERSWKSAVSTVENAPAFEPSLRKVVSVLGQLQKKF